MNLVFFLFVNYYFFYFFSRAIKGFNNVLGYFKREIGLSA